MLFGDRLKEVRLKRGFTQEGLADLLFVTNKTISSWESNRTEPDLNSIIKLSDILSISSSYLIYGDNHKGDIETEIKIKLSKDEFDSLKDYMNKNASFHGEKRQIDTYYQPTYRKFLNDKDNISEWLRIGIRGNKKILNYKNWYDNKYCDEYEVEIDNEKKLEKIFDILGLEKITVVDKNRINYLYLDKYEISLDYVENLGYFIEIEIYKYDSSPLDEYDNLLKICSKLILNLKNIDIKGYPYHFIYN